MIARALPLLVLLATPALADGLPGPREIARDFCAAGITGTMARVEPDLSPALKTSIDTAQRHSDALQAAHPDDKPPLGDGIPWRSWQDSADSCTPGAAKLEGNSASIPVAYAFVATPSADYADTLILIRTASGAWQIDDVAFATGSTLKATLAATLKQ